MAFESLPEYRGLSESETLLDSPRLLDTEYTSDFINYQKPLEWESWWWSKNVGLDFSVGSLSGKEFLIDQRVRIESRLTERVGFKFFWVSDRDLEDDFTNQIIELEFEVNPKLAVAAYTSLSKDKAEDDVGLALIHRQSEIETRLYISLLDFQRNKRNRDTDRFRDGKGPLAYGIVSRKNLREGSLVHRWQEWSWRLEPKSRWEFPVNSREYEHQRQVVQIREFSRVETGHTYSWRLDWDDKQESGVTAGVPGQVRRQRVWAQAEFGRPLNSQFIRYGLHHIWRRFTGLNQHAEFRDWMPFVWWEGPAEVTSYGSRQWQVGYDVVVGTTESHGGWIPEDRNEHYVEHRLNGVHRWRFHENGAVDAIITFDLDRFGTGETWEGGSARLVWSL